MTVTEQPSTGARLARGILSGAIAGLVASFAMDRFQALASAMSSDGSGGEPATEQAADAAAKVVTGHELPAADKPLGGQSVHYALGTLLGVVYGVAAEFRPQVTAGFGTAFGTGIALLLDEAAVPAVGLGEAPWKTPVSTHLYGLTSHLVFGAVAEGVRRSVDATLAPE
jgi:hypothetical protein